MQLPLIIDNHFDGIGDAVVQCWVVNSARAAGLDVRLNIRAYPDIACILGMDDALTVEPGPRYFVDKGQGYHNWKYEREGLGRVRGWMKAYGLPEDLPLVRPRYHEHEAMGRWAACAWEDREAAAGEKKVGGGKRILIFPECAWSNRAWPRPYWIDLAWDLQRAGHVTLALGTTEPEVRGFPAFFYGLRLYNLAALMFRADLVIGNDSGPAHIAGTIGVPTLALMGPTRPDVVFGHVPEVRPLRVTSEELGCVGCHFMGEKGYRPACAHGCRALYMLGVDRVREEAERILRAQPTSEAA